MTRETTSTLPVHGTHAGPGRFRYGAAKPPTDRNLGLTPAWHVNALAALGAAALGLGVWGMTLVDPLQMDGAGLVRILPPLYYIALALSLVAFVGSLALRRFNPALLTWQVVVTVVIVHGADPIIHGLPRLEASFRHLGIADAITRSGELDPGVDAYFNWPGFFSTLGMLSGASGVDDLSGIATWAPLGVNLLLLAPLLALAHRLTANSRQAWAAVWFFYLSSWVGQDYLSPQAYGFLLMVAMFACLLSAFSGWAWPTRSNRFTAKVASVVGNLDAAVPRRGLIELSRRDTLILTVVCSLILLAITASHQLTPFAAITIMAAMLLTGRLRSRILPLLALLLPVLWLLFPASTYLQGHFGQIFGSFGDIGAHTLDVLNSRMTGSDAHVFVVYTRMAEGAVVWILAAIGAFTGYRRKAPWLAAAAGALAPLVLIAAQPYGGELLLRLYLFSLPFAACLAVLPLVSDRPTGLDLRRAVGLLLMGAILATATVVSRYGNESMEIFDADELEVLNELYTTAPTGSILIEAGRNTPWKFRNYADYDYRSLTTADPRTAASSLTCASANQIAGRDGAYLVITEGQRKAAELFGTFPVAELQRFMTECGNSPGWTKIYENAGGVIFKLEGADNGK